MSYADNLATVQRLLSSKGQSVTLTYESDGGYDIATATATLTTSTVTTTGVLLPLSQGVRGFKYGTSAESGTDILSSDQSLFLPGSIDEPVPGTKAAIGSTNYTVIAVSPLNPGGTCVLFECVVRGAG